MYAGEYSPFERSEVIAFRFEAVGSTRYRTGTSGMGWREDAICLTWSTLVRDVPCLLSNIHMHCDSPRPQIIYSQNAADYIPSQVIEYQHFPDWVPVRIQYWRRGYGKTIACMIVMLGRLFFRIVVQIQHALYRP
jgi:hypothetical protein